MTFMMPQRLTQKITDEPKWADGEQVQHLLCPSEQSCMMTDHRPTWLAKAVTHLIRNHLKGICSCWKLLMCEQNYWTQDFHCAENNNDSTKNSMSLYFQNSCNVRRRTRKSKCKNSVFIGRIKQDGTQKETFFLKKESKQLYSSLLKF